MRHAGHALRRGGGQAHAADGAGPSVAVRILWLASVLLPLAVHALALWQALSRMQRQYTEELAQLSGYCGQLADDVQQLQRNAWARCNCPRGATHSPAWPITRD